MFPPPPKDSIDWDNLGFDVTEVDGHVECHYSKETGEWSEPVFVTDPFLRIHGLTPALNYAQQAFEGLKAYRTRSGAIQVFRPRMNARRMARSAAYVSVPAVPEAVFLRGVLLAVARNAAYVPPHGGGAALYVRPIVFGSSATLAMASPDRYTFCVYATPVGMAYGAASVAALVLEDYDRVAPRGTGRAKIGGNYAPLARHIREAATAVGAAGEEAGGYGILLHLDSRARAEIDEFSMAGFVGVRARPEGEEEGGGDGGGGGGYVLVVPEPTRTIESVTADSVCAIARDLGWATESRAVRYEELASFCEVFAVGTAGALVPVRSITRKSTGDVFSYGGGFQERGPCCSKLLTILRDIQQGNVEDRFGWCTTVTEMCD